MPSVVPGLMMSSPAPPQIQSVPSPPRVESLPSPTVERLARLLVARLKSRLITWTGRAPRRSASVANSGVTVSIPLPGSVSEAAGEKVGAFLELLSVDRARFVGRQGQRHLAPGGRLAVVIHAGNGDEVVHAREIDDAKPADLVAVACRIEESDDVSNVVVHSRVARHVLGHHDVVHAGHEPVLGADVREGLDVHTRVRGQLEAPVPFALPDARGYPLVRVSSFQVVGVEVHRLPRGEFEIDRGRIVHRSRRSRRWLPFRRYRHG